jgi:uncharacterized protein (TIGR03435 family)
MIRMPKLNGGFECGNSIGSQLSICPDTELVIAIGNRGKHMLSLRRFAAMTNVIALVLVVTPTTGTVHSRTQSTKTPSPAMEYEVATIKTYRPGGPESEGMARVGISNTDDGFSAAGFTVKMLVQFAYGVPQDYQISGGPDWVKSDKFEIDAKMDTSVAEELKKLSPDERNSMRQKMLQALLADRFKLAIHRETKELPVYTLIIAKNGPKFQETHPDDAVPNAPGGRGEPKKKDGMMVGFDAGMLTMNAKGIRISELIRNWSISLRRPILDKTGLTGKYDCTLRWAPDTGPSDSNDPSLITAIQDQLGLRLESGKAPVEIFMIDHIERPSGN